MELPRGFFVSFTDQSEGGGFFVSNDSDRSLSLVYRDHLAISYRDHAQPHQYPLGMAITLERRQALLAWAERNDAAIIEDDYDSGFRFGGRPLDPRKIVPRCPDLIRSP